MRSKHLGDQKWALLACFSFFSTSLKTVGETFSQTRFTGQKSQLQAAEISLN